MDWADYLRDEAAKYRQLAETAEDVSIKQELLDLAAPAPWTRRSGSTAFSVPKRAALLTIENGMLL
jgi:hypothetical protein